MDEKELIRKLITESHFNVNERAQLPSGVARFSSILAAAEDVLERHGWLPPNRKDMKRFEGGALELRGDTYVLHECHEIGVGRWGELTSRQFSSPSAAVRRWLRVDHGNDIDGIPIAWNE